MLSMKILILVTGLCFRNVVAGYDNPKSYDFSESKFDSIKVNFGDLFWQHVKSIGEENQKIQSECYQNLKMIASHPGYKDDWKNKIQSYAGQFPGKNHHAKSYVDFGNYDQCMESNSPVLTSYCIGSFMPKKRLTHVSEKKQTEDLLSRIEFFSPMHLDIKIGICIPKACSSSNISEIFKHALKDSDWELARDCRCQEKKSSVQVNDLTILQTLAVVSFTLLLALVLLAGFQDIRLMIFGSKKSDDNLLHSCFSPRNNLIELFSSDHGQLRWRRVDQLRLLSFQIVILMHIMFWPLLFAPSLISNLKNFKQTLQSVWAQPFINTYYFEGLIGLGGLTSGVAIWKKTNRDTTLIEYMKIIATRFLSIQPLILATIFLEVLIPIFIAGPGSLIFKESTHEACSDNFLIHITQIKSLTGEYSMCAPHLWSVSTEFHLFIVAVFLIYLYNCNGNLAKLIMNILWVSGFVYTAVSFYRFDLQPGFFVYPFRLRSVYTFALTHYVSTLKHAWFYVYGVFFSALLVEKFDQKINQDWHKRMIQLSKILLIFCSFSSIVFNTFENKPSPTSSAIFIGIVYLCYAFLLTWTMFACADEAREVIFSKNQQKIPSDSQSNGKKRSQFDENCISSGKSASSSIDWQHIFLKLSRVAYFPSTSIIYAFYSYAQKPIDLTSSDHLKNAIIMYLCIFGFAPIFHLLVTGPYSRFMRQSMGSRRKHE